MEDDLDVLELLPREWASLVEGPLTWPSLDALLYSLALCSVRVPTCARVYCVSLHVVCIRERNDTIVSFLMVWINNDSSKRNMNIHMKMNTDTG